MLVRGPISRGELAQQLKLSVASLTRLSKPLLDSGLLVEGELVADGTVGRPVRLLDVRSDSAHFVGVKVTGDLLQAVLTDTRATIAAVATLPLDSNVPRGRGGGDCGTGGAAAVRRRLWG